MLERIWPPAKGVRKQAEALAAESDSDQQQRESGMFFSICDIFTLNLDFKFLKVNEEILVFHRRLLESKFFGHDKIIFLAPKYFISLVIRPKVYFTPKIFRQGRDVDELLMETENEFLLSSISISSLMKKRDFIGSSSPSASSFKEEDGQTKSRDGDDPLLEMVKTLGIFFLRGVNFQK